MNKINHDSKYYKKKTFLINLFSFRKSKTIEFKLKPILLSDFIDFNGHLMESGFYHYGMLGNIDIFEKCGFIDLFSKYKCGPVTFETNIKFKKEIFVKENIKVKLNLRKINEKGEWERLIQINNEKKEISALILSHGRMFNQKKRKVEPPPKEVFDLMKLFLDPTYAS